MMMRRASKLFYVFPCCLCWRYHLVLQFNQLGAQGGQQGFDVAETAPLAGCRRFQNTAQDCTLGGGTVLDLAADDERIIEHRIDFHTYSIGCERQ